MGAATVAMGWGQGGANGPNLTSGNWEHSSGSYEEIVQTITNGIVAADIVHPEHRFAMHARGGMTPLLTDDQVKAVAAYVYSIGHH